MFKAESIRTWTLTFLSSCRSTYKLGLLDTSTTNSVLIPAAAISAL
jgi:hypothetical protein